jgi:flavin reductase (DIM6/NTAB) family NADH-FMN oxidoreductase RutF
MVALRTEDLTPRERARIVKTAVTPRPIAWISTVSVDGVDNLAPFSSYNYVSSAQPVVMFNTPNASAGGLKDTARNAVDTGEFAVNVVTEDLVSEMDRTSAGVPPEEAEFDLAEVERADCIRISPPRVAKALITMECTLYDAIEVHDRLMVLGDVRLFHVDDGALVDGKVDSREVLTVGRLGGPHYSVSNPVEIEKLQ